jgi:CRP-like cAMP-binding protein
MAWTKPNANQSRNLLFRELRRVIGSRTAIDAQTVSLQQSTLVCQPGDEMRHVYFPLSCVLSSVSSHRDGTTLVTTLRGHEGAFGLLTAIRNAKTHARCQVQIGGPALRMDAKQLACIFEATAEARQVFLHYWDAVMYQYEQTAVCYTRHSVTSRLSRYLLEIHDRVIGDAFPFTHQHMANLIAANRTTVSLSTASLRQSGLIETDRGYVRIVDRKGLRAASCDCYARVRSRYELAYGT